MAAEKVLFDTTKEGREVAEFVVTRPNGESFSVIEYGAAIHTLNVLDKDGNLGDVMLGFDTIEGYLGSGAGHGSVIGRTANRIKGGAFTIDGVSIDVLVATYTHDGVTDTALLRYTNLSNGSTSALPVLAGNYKVEAMPLTPDYHLDSVTATSYITVQRATVSIDSFAVEKDKFFDGTDSATITH